MAAGSPSISMFKTLHAIMSVQSATLTAKAGLNYWSIVARLAAVLLVKAATTVEVGTGRWIVRRIGTIWKTTMSARLVSDTSTIQRIYIRCDHLEAQRAHSGTNDIQHQLTHRTAKIRCLGCHRTFKTYGGMVSCLSTCRFVLTRYSVDHPSRIRYLWQHQSHRS
jgi:hypothetical protein